MMNHPSNKITQENIEEIFEYHHADPWRLKHYDAIRIAAKHLSYAILQNTPDCSDRSAALRKLREVVMTANASVALAKQPWE